jgi:hypothetical protein
MEPVPKPGRYEVKVNCSCGGYNENCHLCSGSGTIDDKLAKALLAHRNHCESGAVCEPDWTAAGGTVCEGQLICTDDYLLSLKIADHDDQAFLRGSLIKVDMDRSRLWLWYADSERARKLLKVKARSLQQAWCCGFPSAERRALTPSHVPLFHKGSHPITKLRSSVASERQQSRNTQEEETTQSLSSPDEYSCGYASTILIQNPPITNTQPQSIANRADRSKPDQKSLKLRADTSTTVGWYQYFCSLCRRRQGER